MQAIYVMSFLRALGGTIMGNCVPLFVRLQGGSDIVTSFVQSAYSIVYIISPLLLHSIGRRLGLRKSVVLSTSLALIDITVYLSLWPLVTPTIFGTLVAVFFSTRIADGFLNGLYWPLLESRIAEERLTMADPSQYEGCVRYYNLGWNVGSALGNALLIVATLPPTIQAIITSMFWTMVLAAVCLVGNFALAIASFQNVQYLACPPVPQLKLQEKSVVQIVPETPRREAFKKIATAYVVVFMWGFTINAVIQTMLNQFTFVTVSGVAGSDVIPFMAIGFSLRSVFQAISSSSIKIPLRPRRWFLPTLALFAACTGTLGVTFVVSPSIGAFGIAITLVIIAVIGFVGGAMYSASLGEVVSGSNRANAQLFAGLFESIDGAGALGGILMSGAVTQTAPYATPYFLNFGFLVASIALVIALQKRWGKIRPSQKFA